MTNQELNDIYKEYGRLEEELERIKKAESILKENNALQASRLKVLEKDYQDLHKRWLIATDFIHSLAVGFPMGFWTRVRRAGEVLKKINP